MHNTIDAGDSGGGGEGWVPSIIPSLLPRPSADHHSANRRILNSRPPHAHTPDYPTFHPHQHTPNTIPQYPHAHSSPVILT
ncbi:hypothetical protein Pcinc_042558 [Petrolisthes cinctipes]|uniref:Uncharacterized protein n=1 Tax=Petrolisthes cinctipes TaxID=88211 RepID=A0AAE1EFV5_PETCI|nr:hypothetical protein Pcinc_042558 [Petrolisthes cinctipes]